MHGESAAGPELSVLLPVTSIVRGDLVPLVLFIGTVSVVGC